MTYPQILAATQGCNVGGSPLDRAIQYDDLLAERERYEVTKADWRRELEMRRLDNCRLLFGLLERVQQALSKDDRLHGQIPALVAIRAAVLEEYQPAAAYAEK